MWWENGPAASLRKERGGSWMTTMMAAAVVVMVVIVVCLCLDEKSWEGQLICGTGGVGLPW